MNEETIYQIIKKLIGDIRPKGDSSRDHEIFDNVKIACGLIERLIVDIDDVAYVNRNSYEYSVKEISDYIDNFLKNKIGIEQ